MKTVDEAAAPHSSLAFMFWGEGVFVFPLMLIYTAVSYRLFRGKVRSAPEHSWIHVRPNARSRSGAEAPLAGGGNPTPC
jgi:hypothetical protein